MTRQVRLSPDAAHDLDRLAVFLVEVNPDAALRAADEIIRAVMSLDEFAERGRPLRDGFRKLVIPFGRYAYVAEYQVEAEAVFVTRIRHSHEARKGPG